jgi:hypothetical protein
MPPTLKYESREIVAEKDFVMVHGRFSGFGGGPRLALDLEELDLVDVEGVCFLNACEAEGISVLHCSPYIREWMIRERGRSKSTEL